MKKKKKKAIREVWQRWNFDYELENTQKPDQFHIIHIQINKSNCRSAESFPTIKVKTEDTRWMHMKTQRFEDHKQLFLVFFRKPLSFQLFFHFFSGFFAFILFARIAWEIAQSSVNGSKNFTSETSKLGNEFGSPLMVSNCDRSNLSVAVVIDLTCWNKNLEIWNRREKNSRKKCGEIHRQKREREREREKSSKRLCF